MDFKIEDYFGKMCAARIRTSEFTESVSLVRPVRFHEDGRRVKVVWDIGPSYTVALFVSPEQPLGSGQAQILHCYGPAPETDKEWDEMDLHFLNTYYPANPTDPPEPDKDGAYLGWISPKGDYYRASFENHDGTARSIVATLENRVLGGRQATEYLMGSWVQVRSARSMGFILGRNALSLVGYSITLAQRNTILNVQELCGISFEAALEMRNVVPN